MLILFNDLFLNNNYPGHFFMTAPAKVVTVKREAACIHRDKPQPGYLSGGISVRILTRAAESVLSVQ